MLDMNSASSGGPSIEYSSFIQWANVTGDYAKMRPCSNLLALIKRLIVALFIGIVVV